MKVRHCYYCNRVITGKQLKLKEDVCDTCYAKRKQIRWFRSQIKPLIDLYEERKANNDINN